MTQAATPIFMVSIAPDSTMARAYLLMNHFGLDALPVTVGDDIIGIVTNRDVAALVKSYAAGNRGRELTVGAHMKGPVRMIDADSGLSDGIRTLLDDEVPALVVLREGEVIGLLSREDLLEAFAGLAGSTGLTAAQLLELRRANRESTGVRNFVG